MADFETESCASDETSQTALRPPGGLGVVLMLCAIAAAVAGVVACAYFIDARAIGAGSGCTSMN